jgi:hypothetical protein
MNFGKWMAAPLVAVTSFLFAADTPTASADHGGFRVGGLSISIGNRGYRSAYRSYSPTYRSHYGRGIQYGHRSHYGHGSYHDTSHYDYHPTEVIRHGNHYDVMPGHYDFHRTGHYHHR